MVDISVISKGRLLLTAERPFLATPLWRVFIVESPGLGTMAVDKHWRLYYDPALTWNANEVAAVLYHEIQHLLRNHSERGEAHNAQAWNYAADAEINDDIISEKIWKLPTFKQKDGSTSGCVTPKTIDCEDNKLAEYYYGRVMKHAKNCDCGGHGDGSGGIPNPGAGNCGSGADGNHRHWEQGDGDGTAPKISPAEAGVIARKVAEEVRTYKKSRGEVPGDWDRWASEILEPKVNWAAELRAKISNSIASVAGMVDYSYRRPARRAAANRDIIFPAMIRPVVRVAVVIDTSGSMGQDDVSAAVAEVGGILRALGVSEGVQVYSCDAAVHTAQKVFNAKQVQLGGGGGTDMRVGMEVALETRPKPHVLIVLTDGWTPWPDKAPKNVQTIIGIIGKSGDRDTPSWAKKVIIEPD